MNAVAVENLTKRFAGSVALDRVSFTVAPGELFGFIGPDGAGKTTLFRILVTLLEPDAGRASVLGRDVVKEFRALRARVGYMPGRFSLYPDLSVEENLRFFASVFGTTIDAERARIAPIYSQLEPFKDRTVIMSGLHSRSAEPPPGVTGADHWVAAAFLCANKPRKTAGADVYAGTTIMGADTVIGAGSTIGANVFLTHGVPPRSLVFYEEKQLRILDKRSRENDALEWVI